MRPITNRHAVIEHDELVHWLAALLSLHHGLYGVFAVRAEVSVYIELDKETLHGEDVEGTVISDKDLSSLF